MNGQELVHAARLEGVYGIHRKLQSVHNSFETRCIGDGGCCKVGLFISLGECWNIARELRRAYWMNAECNGLEEADRDWEVWIGDLKYAFHKQSDWSVESQETNAHCAFYQDGMCGIYDFRPLVCRSYGVHAPVQEGVCPRKRLPDGGIELIRDDSVRKALEEFDSLILAWDEARPDLAYSMYMPAGVLRFLLSTEELQELIATTEEKFWMASPGYKHQLSPDNWGTETPVTLRSKP